MGVTPMGVSCDFDKPTAVATPAKLAAAIAADLPVHKPTAAGSTVTVAGAGWASAAWFVCNAELLGIDSVRYNGHEWSRAKGWRTQDAATSSAVSATLAKL